MTELKLKLTAVSAILLALLQFVLPAAGQAVKAQSQGKGNPNMTISNDKESPLACNASALDAQQRLRIRVLLNLFHSSQQGIKELPSGYAVRLPGESSIIHDVAEYITLERLCCPFFDFALEAEREGGPISLTLTGREGVKEFARIEFGIQPHPNANAAATTVTESPLVCNDGALNAAQGARLVALLKEFRAAKQDTNELPAGYAIRLPNSTAMVQDVAEYMAIVRLCSPYFETTLEVGCEGGPVWLKLAGREGVKELAKAELRN
jgi:hypothetical protein